MNRIVLEQTILGTILVSGEVGGEEVIKLNEKYFTTFFNKAVARKINDYIDRGCIFALLGDLIEKTTHSVNENRVLELISINPVVNVNYYYKILVEKYYEEKQ